MTAFIDQPYPPCTRDFPYTAYKLVMVSKSGTLYGIHSRYKYKIGEWDSAIGFASATGFASREGFFHAYCTLKGAIDAKKRSVLLPDDIFPADRYQIVIIPVYMCGEVTRRIDATFSCEPYYSILTSKEMLIPEDWEKRKYE